MTLESAFRQAVQSHRAGDLAAAIRGYRAILRDAPGLRLASENLCLALLSAGDYAEGFSLYDGRFLRDVGRVVRPRLPFPEWQGEPLDGRSILVWPEQGLGDQIMFARFVRELAALGARVSLAAPRSLARLFSALPATVLPDVSPAAVQAHDVWAMVGSLPGRLGVSLETLPNSPYLPSGDQGSGIGVVTRGDPRHHNDANRSLPADQATRLLALPGALSLHPDDTGAKDFQATADLIAGLSLVITVDTAVAHLTGAMGKPVWVLLPSNGVDWRWGLEGETSVWYPTARLFRQGLGEGWEAVVDRVFGELRL